MFERAFADPYIIAEIGVNHEGSLARAKSMIESVARAGGHAAKFQTYKAELLASRTSSPSYWDRTKEPTESQFELFSRLDSFSAAEYQQLAEHCSRCGIDFLSTPFDLDSVDLIAPLVPAMKIASADITNVPLIRAVGATGLPVIVSSGAATHAEIDFALQILEQCGVEEISLLHCVLRYPTPPQDANLTGIKELNDRFGSRAVIGYSDHVSPDAQGGVPALIMAVLFGARVIEKHFTDDRSAKGNDHYHAFDESGLASFVEQLAAMRPLAGNGIPDILGQQAAVENARRRIFFARDVVAGERLCASDLVALRANEGVEVSKWDSAVGALLKYDKAAGDVLHAEDL